MRRHISKQIRQAAFERANFRCEYCRIYERYSFLAFHLEHIVSLKHGGDNTLENLALACPICNLNKGTDIATFIDSINKPIRFFNPRNDDWKDHFEIQMSGLILPKTEIGEATLKIFDFNNSDSMLERELLVINGLF